MTANKSAFSFRSDEMSLDDWEPMKTQLREQVNKRMKARMNGIPVKKASKVNVTLDTSSDDMKKFLKDKQFSSK